MSDSSEAPVDGPFDLSTTYIHLGLGATATALPNFDWASIDDYAQRFAADGETAGS